MFLTSSLESVVQSLRKTDETQFKHLESLMSSHYPGTDFKLLLRKGVFPYEYLDSFVKVDDNELQYARSFSAYCEMMSALRRTTTTRRACGQPSGARHSRTISSCIWRATYASWPICSKTLGASAIRINNSTPRTLFRRRSSLGTQCLKCRISSAS